MKTMKTMKTKRPAINTSAERRAYGKKPYAPRRMKTHPILEARNQRLKQRGLQS
jgi:hypothetical protein